MLLLMKGNKAIFTDITAVVFDTLYQCVTEKEKIKFTPALPRASMASLPLRNRVTLQPIQGSSTHLVAEIPNDRGGIW